MRCVICKSPEIEKKVVQEEYNYKKDIVLVPIELMVCTKCGERYYDRKTMRLLEDIEKKIKMKKLPLKTVGRVLRPKVA